MFDFEIKTYDVIPNFVERERNKWPFHKLAVGQYFDVPEDSEAMEYYTDKKGNKVGSPKIVSAMRTYVSNQAKQKVIVAFHWEWISGKPNVGGIRISRSR